MSVNNYSSPITDLDGIQYAGPSYHPDFPISGYKEHIIKPDEEYRADKIAYRLLGSDNLSWVLDVANNFTHGFKEYKEGVTIRYPIQEAIKAMGIR